MRFLILLGTQDVRTRCYSRINPRGSGEGGHRRAHCCHPRPRHWREGGPALWPGHCLVGEGRGAAPWPGREARGAWSRGWAAGGRVSPTAARAAGPPTDVLSQPRRGHRRRRPAPVALVLSWAHSPVLTADSSGERPPRRPGWDPSFHTVLSLPDLPDPAPRKSVLALSPQRPICAQVRRFQQQMTKANSTSRRAVMGT